jgi:hypothetical protein
MASLTENLHNLNTRTWPQVFEQIRFLESVAFERVVLLLFWELTLKARSQRASRRSRKYLDRLWPLLLSKLKREALREPLQFSSLACSQMLWLMGNYYQVWGGFDDWQDWLSVRFSASEWLLQLSLMLASQPGWRPATRRALLIFVMGLLESVPEAEVQLEILGALTHVARQLKLQTQAELLLEEMAVLLMARPPVEQPHLAFQLGLQWWRYGFARQARFALRCWQEHWPQLSQAQQAIEIELILSAFEQLQNTRRRLRFEQLSFLHSWLEQLVAWLLEQKKAHESLFLRLQSLAVALKWPESKRWKALLKKPFYQALLGSSVMCSTEAVTEVYQALYPAFQDSFESLCIFKQEAILLLP